MNITLNINDCVCTNSCKNVVEKEVTFTSQTDSYELQGNFILNVILVSLNQYTVIIQNGRCVIIRNVLNGIPTSILLPSKCGQHIVTLTST